METPTYERRLRALAAAVGGISTLAARCRVPEARIIAWFSGAETPSADEQYVLQLIAHSAGVELGMGSSVPPRSSYIRESTPARAGSGAPPASAPTHATAAEPDPLSYEAYTEWLKTR